MIRLTDLTKRYGGFTAVDALNLEVPKGELFGFLGPNGAGKTTTLRMIAGILRPTGGRVEIGGTDIVKDPIAAKTRLGFIPDRPFIYEKLTGAEFLRFVAGLYGQSGPRVEHRPEVIAVDEPMVGLDPKAARILKDLFREYTRRGNTIMMSTHTLEVAEAMCDRIAIIQGGKIRACGTMAQLRQSAEEGAQGLEHIFLRLTGESAARELVAVLDA